MEQYDYITAWILYFRFQNTEQNQYNYVTNDIVKKKSPNESI